MKVRKGASFDETQRPRMMVFGFTGEPCDDVGTDGGVREMFGNEPKTASVVFGAIPAVHRRENFVGAGLQRHVEVFREPRCRSEKFDEIASDVERLDGTEAKAGDIGFGKDLFEKVEEVVARREIAAPCAEVNTGQDDFLVAGIGKVANLVDDGSGGYAAAFAANERDDAEGTAVVAAILNF